MERLRGLSCFGYTLLGALKNVVDKKLTNEESDTVNLSIGHEVGNRYVGDFRYRKDGYNTTSL